MQRVTEMGNVPDCVSSNFDLILTKLRNRLGMDKVQNITFYCRMLRGTHEVEYYKGGFTTEIQPVYKACDHHFWSSARLSHVLS